MAESGSPDFPEYDGRTAEVWDRLAECWDDKIGDGNDFQNHLIEPSTERLLALPPGERVLDVACGAGRFARRMAVLGAMVVAIDHAESFIRRAPTSLADYLGVSPGCHPWAAYFSGSALNLSWQAAEQKW